MRHLPHQGLSFTEKRNKDVKHHYFFFLEGSWNSDLLLINMDPLGCFINECFVFAILAAANSPLHFSFTENPQRKQFGELHPYQMHIKQILFARFQLFFHGIRGRILFASSQGNYHPAGSNCFQLKALLQSLFLIPLWPSAFTEDLPARSPGHF